MRENYRIRSSKLIMLGALGILSTGACTSRDIYEARQHDAHRACLNKPEGIERDNCLDRTSESYDEFTREREKVQKDEQ